MATVSLHRTEPDMPQETPSQRIINKANEIQYVTDGAGRKIGWRPVTGLDDFDLVQIAGPDNARNTQLMARATLAFAVRSLDGETISRPSNWDQLRVIVGRLDNAGMEAVLMAMSEYNGAQGGDEERVKNSHGTPTPA